MAYPSYGEIATSLEIDRCHGMLPTGHRCPLDHRRGVIGGGRVHWADRGRVERAGIRRFLRLAATLHQQQLGEERPWARLYLAQPMINRWGKELGITFPASATEVDKLEVKAQLVNIPTNEPLREEAMAWAQGK